MAELSVKGLVYSLGILGFADGLVHGLLMSTGREFLWWNKAVWELFYTYAPGAGASFGGAIMAGIWCGAVSAVGAALFGWIYNKAVRW